MSSGYDFRKEWPKIKKELTRAGAEAAKMAKKGEKEIRRLSQKGKWQFDVTALKLKQNHLHALIGKEYISAKSPNEPTAALKKYVAEWHKIDKEIKSLNRKIKTFSQVTARKRS